MQKHTKTTTSPTTNISGTLTSHNNKTKKVKLPTGNFCNITT